MALEIPDSYSATETDWNLESSASVDAEPVTDVNLDAVTANNDVDSDRPLC